MAEHQVLFVCAQNVCRSPYLATSLALRLAQVGLDSFATDSRGTRVRAPQSMCEVAAGRLASAHGWIGSVTWHQSRVLVAEDLDGADLILTAGVAERSAVAIIDPSSRARLFTVREAVWLSEGGLSSEDRRTTGAEPSLRGFAEVLHSRRGTIALPEAQRRSFWRFRSAGTEVSVLDIADRHTEGRSAHRGLFPELDRDVEALARSIGEVLRGD